MNNTHYKTSAFRQLLNYNLHITKTCCNFAVRTGEYQSGQMGQTVNLLVFTFGGSNPSSPTLFPYNHTQNIVREKLPNRGLTGFDSV